jgi:methionyl-tRNA synthetase
MSYNKELAGGLGNLLNRTLNMAHKYRAGGILTPAYTTTTKTARCARPSTEAGPVHRREDERLGHPRRHCRRLEDRHPREPLRRQHPALQASPRIPRRRRASTACCYHLAEALVHVSVLLDPILPEAMAKARAQIGWQRPEGFGLGDLRWGLLAAGHQLGAPVPLFPQLDPETAGERWAEFLKAKPGA